MQEYFEALERLVKNKPKVVLKGTKISNDTVALEAGRGKGSIKKSRPQFSVLIEQIKDEAQRQKDSSDGSEQKIAKLKSQVKKYREMYEESVSREVSLYHENLALKKRIKLKK